jgi:ankyrin repeat protein
MGKLGYPAKQFNNFRGKRMSYPTSTFQRSDSQPGLYARTQQQGSSANAGQQSDQSQQNPHNSSLRPRFESRSSSSSMARQSLLSEFYGHELDDHWPDQELEDAKATVMQIKERIRGICKNADLDIGGVIQLFSDIKKYSTQNHLRYIREQQPGFLEGLSEPLYQVIRKLDRDLYSVDGLVNSLNAEDIHTLFNGFSAIVGESVRDSLLAKSHFNLLKQPLNQITNTLLVRAVDQNLMQKHWDSSSLVNALNWVSRSLKKKILQTDDLIVKQVFTRALMMMKDWTSTESGIATTLVKKLDTRQLGKCMVQAATVLKYGLLTEEAPDHLLRDVVLGLCGGKALDQCTLWQKNTDGGQAVDVLTTVRPNGVEVTNIGNTVKDCLKQGIFRLEEKPVQSIIHKLCGQMNSIAESTANVRQGQLLSNCGNFLREIFEFEHAAAQSLLQERTEYDNACKQVLAKIAGLSVEVMPDEQSIANLFSFVKAMDRTRRQSSESLRAATSVLVNQSQKLREGMEGAESIAATLGGLQHLALRGLTPRDTAAHAMLRLIHQIDLKELTNWPASFSATVMRAVLYCWERFSAGTSLRKSLQVLMEQLLDLPVTKSDRYPYLRAAAVLIEQDDSWVPQNQLVLSGLLPEMAGSVITQGDVEKALVALNSNEPAIEKLPAPDLQTRSGDEQEFPGGPTITTTTNTTTTTTTTAVTFATTTTAQAAAARSPMPRLPVGMTRLIEPEKKNTAAANTTTTATTNTTKTTTTKPVSTPGHSPADSRKLLSLVANTTQHDIPLLVATEPKSMAGFQPAAGRPEATAKKRPPEKKPAVEVQKRQGDSTTQSASMTKASPKAKVTRQQDIPVLVATEPKLVLRTKPAGGKPEVATKKTPEKTPTVKEQKSQGDPTTKPASTTKAPPNAKAAKLTPEQEWFGLLKQESALSAPQRQRLQALLKAMPNLAVSTEGKGPKARSALFYALSTGKPEAVGLIMQAGSQARRDIAGTLKQFFEDTLIVGDSEAKALRECLSSLSESELAALRDALNKQYQLGEMQKKVAAPFWDVLESMGFVSKESAAIDDSRNLVKRNGKNTAGSLARKSNNHHSYSKEQTIIKNIELIESLMLAAVNGDVQYATSLLSQNLDDKLLSNIELYGFTVLMRAAFNGHAAIVELLIDRDSGGGQTKIRTTDGLNALMLAAHAGHAAVVKLLIDHDSGTKQATISNNNEWNALMWAAQHGHVDTVKLLIEHGSGAAQAKMKNKDRCNALMIAAQNGHADTVKLLIEHDSGAAQAKMTNMDRCNALMIAAQNGHAAVVKLLIDHDSGAEQAKMMSEDGFNALMLAAQKGHAAIIKLLIDHDSGSEQAKMSKDGFNALMLAAQRGHAPVVKLLIDHTSGAEQAKMTNKYVINALMLAAREGHAAVVKFLIDHDSGEEQATTKNEDGLNALMLAAQKGHAAVVKLLIDDDSGEEQVTTRSKYGRNALMIAAQEGHADTVKLLIDHKSGAGQAKMTDDFGWNALMLAARYGHADTVKLLIDRKSGADQATSMNKQAVDAFMISAETLYAAAVKSLIQYDYSEGQTAIVNKQDLDASMINSQKIYADTVAFLFDHDVGAGQARMIDKNGSNALMIAAENGHAAIVELLLGHYSWGQLIMMNNNGWNALMIAARHGHTAVVKLLIDHDNGLEQTKMMGRGGWNALMLAAENGHTDVVKLLIEHDSGEEQAKFINKDFFNALMIAAQNGHADVVELLIDHDPEAEQATMRNKDGFTALMIAESKGHKAIVELLRHKSQEKATEICQ